MSRVQRDPQELIERADQVIPELEAIAEELKHSIGSRKRPLVVEFSGLPKAGKTTAAHSLALFLRRNKVPTKIVTERASTCPITKKQHPFFNVWTGCTSLAQILEHLESAEYKVLIVDRGVFDALVWLRLLRNRSRMDDDELTTLEGFFLMSRWVQEIDLVIQMRTSPDSALEREFSTLLTRKEGSIMNRDMLSDYLLAVDEVKEDFGDRFRLIPIDTEEKETIDGVEEITRAVLTALRELSDEELAVVPQSEAKARLPATVFDDSPHRLRTLDSLLQQRAQIVRRSEAESNAGLLQFIVCTLITFKEQILLFRKQEIDPRKRMHNSNMIWVGGHLRGDDLEVGELPRHGIIDCLKRELVEELSLSVRADPKYLGLVYDQTHPKSVLHMGVVFQVELPDRKAMSAFGLGRVFREFAGQQLVTHWVDVENFRDDVENVEPWSQHILRAVHGVQAEETDPFEQLWLLG